MVNIFFCDDDSGIRERYRDIITRIAAKHDIDISLSISSSGEALLFSLSENIDAADIIYLDIVMSDLDGLETAKRLRALGCHAQIIFLTTIKDYVYESFDVLPIHYLLKNNTSQAKFEQVFLRAVELAKVSAEDKFTCKSGTTHKVIPTSTISHFEIWQGVITVYYGENEQFKYWMTMEELINQLQGKTFVRAHRSYIVNMQFISVFKRRSLVLKNGVTIPIGVTYREKIKDAFAEYVANKPTVESI